jgi:alkylation response protein AidB-like acyl-CoA dehydrogenase
MADHGFAGLHWPVECGGRGLTKAHTAVWYEECARLAVTPYLNLQGLVLAGQAILRSGTDAQRRTLLPGTLTGETLWCQLFSEPGAGSDLASLQTTAAIDGDRFVVNGQKVWTSNAQFAEQAIMMARTDPTTPGHRGISFFVIDMGLPGIDVRPLRQMTGDAEFCEVFLDDVAVPADALLGPLHGGWQVAMDVLQDERGSGGSSGLISLERRLSQLRTLTADSPALRLQLVRLLERGMALKAMLMRSDGGPAAASAGKLMRSEIEFDAQALEVALLGAAGTVDGAHLRPFLYSPGMKLGGGTSEIQRNIIAERILGLPR